MNRIVPPLFVLLTGIACIAVGGGPAVSMAASAPPTLCRSGQAPDGSSELTLDVPGWPDRAYDLRLPTSHRCGTPIGVVVVYHGGGGNKDVMRPLTCPQGDTRSEACLDRRILAAGMAVVFADGTRPFARLAPGAEGLRTWNAGGGQGKSICVSGYACDHAIDDIGFTRALLADLARHIDIDGRSVFATGFSNGAAMVHRLACEASDTFAAVASVEGENQFVLNGCMPSTRVAVLDIHGTADRCWPYEGGPGGCVQRGQYESVDSTLATWIALDACNPSPTMVTLPPRPGVDDGTSVVRFTYAGCAQGGRLEHLQVVGNGHYWPDGKEYASPKLLGGTMSRQLDTAQAIVDFFAANVRP